MPLKTHPRRTNFKSRPMSRYEEHKHSQDGQKMDTGMLRERGFMGAEKTLQCIPLQKLRATKPLRQK